MAALFMTKDTLIIFDLVKQSTILTQQKCPESARTPVNRDEARPLRH